MADVRIFGTVISTYTRIVEIVAHEAGLSTETIPTPAQSPENRHPFGKIPVVEIDGLELFETVAIAQYIDNAHNVAALQPRDPAMRALMDRWIAVGNSYLFPLFERGLVMPRIMHSFASHPLDKGHIARHLPLIERNLAYLDYELQLDGGWTKAGFTLADVFLYVIVRGVQLTPEGQELVSARDTLSAWMASTAQRPSVEKTRWTTEK